MDLLKEMITRETKDSRNSYLNMIARKNDLDDICFIAGNCAARDLSDIPYLLDMTQNAVTACRNLD